MRELFKYIVVLFFLLLFYGAQAQTNRQEDSLLSKIAEEKNDSTKAELYLYISDIYKNSNPDRSYKYATLSYELAKRRKNYSTMLSAMNEIAYVFYSKSDFLSAKTKWIQLISLSKKFGRKVHLSAYNNIAGADMAMGKNKEAMDYLFLAMKDVEKYGKPIDKLTIYGNIGKIFGDLGDYEQSNYYYNKCFLLQELSPKISEQIPVVLNNMGFNYMKNKSLDTAERYFNRALKILETKPFKMLEANIYNNLAEVYFHKNDFKGELNLIEKSLKIRREINNKDGIIYALTYLGGIYKRNGNGQKFTEVNLEALELAKEIRSLSHTKRIAKNLYLYYKDKNETLNELIYYKEYISAKDSLKAQETIKEANKLHLTFQFEKRIYADSIEHANESRIRDIEIQNQKAELRAEKTIKYSIIIGLVCLILFAVFLYNKLNLIRKQNNLIENQKIELLDKNKKLNEQNVLIEEKQTEILSSIHYAKRIQDALLPTEKLIQKILNKRK